MTQKILIAEEMIFEAFCFCNILQNLNFKHFIAGKVI